MSLHSQNTPPPHSHTFSLPNDLQINHYRTFQTRIFSQSLQDVTNAKINKVKHHLHTFNQRHAGIIGLTDSTITAEFDEDDQSFDDPADHASIGSCAMTDRTLPHTNVEDSQSDYEIGNSDHPHNNHHNHHNHHCPLEPPNHPTMDPETESILLSRYTNDHISHLYSNSVTTARQLNNNTYQPIPHLAASRVRKIQRFITAINAINEAKRIVIVAGAGMSVSCGIPDFRSENGLYSLLGEVDFGDDKFEADLLFELNYFKSNPLPFYTFYYKMGLCADMVEPSFCHKFVKMLEDKGKLVAMFSQNIDGLEKKIGLTKHLNCHGNDDEFYCLDCNIKFPKEAMQWFLERHEIPYCQAVREKIIEQYTSSPSLSQDPHHPLSVAYSTILSHAADHHEMTQCNGLYKPCITFFNEQLPQTFMKTLQSDMNPDLILVIGTSLAVAPVAHIPDYLSEFRGSQCDVLYRKVGELTHHNLSNEYDLRQLLLLHGPRNTALDHLGFDVRHVPIITINRESLLNIPASLGFEDQWDYEDYLESQKYGIDGEDMDDVKPTQNYFRSDENEGECVSLDGFEGDIDLLHEFCEDDEEKNCEIGELNEMHENDAVLDLTTNSQPRNQNIIQIDSEKQDNVSSQSLNSFNESIPQNQAELSQINAECDEKPIKPIRRRRQPPKCPNHYDFSDDGLSEGNYDEWVKDHSVEDEDGEVYQITTRGPPPVIPTLQHVPLTRCEYEFLGDCNSVAQFIVKALGW